VNTVEFYVDLPALLQWRLVFPEVRLSDPVVVLETVADGCKAWLLDTQQSDENVHVFFGTMVSTTIGATKPYRWRIMKRRC
jgi:uncharacterized protein involved in outer membrane biogenesis